MMPAPSSNISPRITAINSAHFRRAGLRQNVPKSAKYRGFCLPRFPSAARLPGGSPVACPGKIYRFTRQDFPYQARIAGRRLQAMVSTGQKFPRTPFALLLNESWAFRGMSIANTPVGQNVPRAQRSSSILEG
jgi:hypothetical protein